MNLNERRPLDDNPDGYMESDKDYVLNNLDLAVFLLDNANDILPALKDYDPMQRAHKRYNAIERLIAVHFYHARETCTKYELLWAMSVLEYFEYWQHVKTLEAFLYE